MTHTKVPWYVTGSEVGGAMIVSDDSGIIARWPIHGKENSVANARLIAAAPEILEALKLIMGKAAAGKLSNELGKHVKLENIIADCQSIIAKADGNNE